MKKTTATWFITLDTECPHCNEDIDILEIPDIWERVNFDIGEHNTESSKDVKILCPECEEEFLIDLEY